MLVEFIEAPYHMGRLDSEVGSGPMRIAATGIAVELGLRRMRVDAGESSTVDQVNAALEQEALRVRRHGGFPFVLAGNCNSAFGTVAALAAEGIAEGTPGIVWFDAHGDFNTPETSISGLLDGMALAIVSERHVPEDRIVLAGVRDLDPLEEQRVSASAMTVVSSGKLTPPQIPPGPVYVHLDMDVLSPAVSPGVNFQVEGGLQVSELEDALRVVFAGTRVAALALVNYNPHRDPESRTLHITCDLVRLICNLAGEQ